MVMAVSKSRARKALSPKLFSLSRWTFQSFSSSSFFALASSLQSAASVVFSSASRLVPSAVGDGVVILCSASNEGCNYSMTSRSVLSPSSADAVPVSFFPNIYSSFPSTARPDRSFGF
jgi:hypothetical protein